MRPETNHQNVFALPLLSGLPPPPNKQRPLLTVLPRVSGHYPGLRAPALVVPGLDLDLVRHKGGSVFHHKRVSLHHVLLPVLLHVLSPVAHLVLQTGTIVLDGEQRLQDGKAEMKAGSGPIETWPSLCLRGNTMATEWTLLGAPFYL